MPGKSWTTPDQHTFLEGEIPAYLKHQSDHRLFDFFATVSKQFFTRWLERLLRFPPGKDETTCKLTPGEELELASYIVKRKEVCLAVIMLIWAGPQPSAGGAIQVRSMHAGTTEAGCTFADSHPSFETQFLRPFHAFARNLYPTEVRTSCALRTSSLVEIPDDHVNAPADNEVLDDQLATADNEVLTASDNDAPAVADSDVPATADNGVQDDDDLYVSSTTPAVDNHAITIESPFKIPPIAMGDLISMDDLFVMSPLPPSSQASPTPPVIETPRPHLGTRDSPASVFETPRPCPHDSSASSDVETPCPRPRPRKTSASFVIETPCPHRGLGSSSASSTPSIIDSHWPGTYLPVCCASTPSVIDTPRRPRPKPRRATGPQPERFTLPLPHSIMNMPLCRLPPSPPKPLAVAREVPAWMREAVAHLEEFVLADRWTVCILVWKRFEETVGYGDRSDAKASCLNYKFMTLLISTTPQRLPGDAHGRPMQFSWWTKRARKYMSPLPIDDLPSFVKTFKAWWAGMVETNDNDWGILRTGGQNGFLVVMLLLCWWGRTKVTHEWKATVDEATTCLDKMSNRKRPSGIPQAAPRKSSRPRKTL